MAKIALCIGINDYPGTNMDLRGCVNDANDWAAVLEDRGFAVTKLLDAGATKKAMVEGIRETLGRAKSGDSVVLTFAGHGTYAPDENGDESDFFDEGLCPYDIRKAGALIDDEIHELFAARKSGVRLVLISDSCHSGTVTRAAPAEADAEGPRPRFMPIGNWLPEQALPLLKQHGDLLLAGCAEGQNNFSYDARIGGRFNGAFTAYALRTLRSLPAAATYADWHKAISKYLPSASYPQAPQLFGDAAARARKPFA
jgi:hypothetical protein